MALQFFNSLTRKKEIFHPIDEGKIGLYTCGPTVYDYAHIGNFRTFMFEDLLKRWLTHLDFEVNHIMNITDIDDKTIKRAQDNDMSLIELTTTYTNYFLDDLKWLKMIPANQYPKATNAIPKMIRMIEILLDKGFAYREDDGSVYFNIRSFPDYGQLSNLNLTEQRKGDRVADDEYDKNSPQDFALWKGWKEEDGDVVWDAPWGKGRPGWHIECSAMSNEALGEHFDIHCGGVDNMFPHHENEIAQSQCATDQPFVNVWLHSEFLLVDGGKMSKSLGNYYRVSDLKKIGFSPECIRFQLLSGHYRTKINFSIDKKQEGDRVVQRINEFYNRLKKLNASQFAKDEFPDVYPSFRDRMNDDLDTPRSLAIFFDYMKSINSQIDNNTIANEELGKAWTFLNVFDSIFGFIKREAQVIPPEIQSLLSERKLAREGKDWKLSDSIRDKIKSKGWIVVDTPDGQEIKKLN